MVASIIRYAKEDLKLKKLVSGTAAGNIPSVKLLLGSGFKIIKEETSSFAKDEKAIRLLRSVTCLNLFFNPKHKYYKLQG